MSYLKKLWANLEIDSRKSQLIFWGLIIVIGLSSRNMIFEELRDEDLLVSNELLNMDMENFLNQARVMEEKDRWLSDFRISDKNPQPKALYGNFHQAPLYAYFLAVSARLFNIDMDYGHADHRHAISLGENMQVRGRGYEGHLDDVRIYARALSTAQLKSHRYNRRQAQRDGLIAHWPLEQQKGRSINLGAYGGLGRWYGDGKLKTSLETSPPQPNDKKANHKNRGSLKFSGKDYVLAEQSKSLKFNQITVSLWMKSKPFSKKYQTLIAKGDETWRLARHENTHGLQFAVAQGGAWVNGSRHVDDNKWHHVVGIYDGENIYLFIDGKLDATKKYSGGIGKNNGYLALFWVQQLLGLIALWPLFMILKRLNGLRVARFATFCFLFSQLSVFYELLFLRATLLSFFYLFIIHHLLILIETKTILRAFTVGLFLGLAWVCKPVSLPFIPLIILWLAWQKPKEESWKPWSQRLGFLVFGILLMLAPFINRNLEVNKRAQADPSWTAEELPALSFSNHGARLAYITGNSHRAFRTGFSLSNPGSTKGLGYSIINYNDLFFDENANFAREVLQKDPGDDSWKENRRSTFSVMRLVWAEHSREGSWFDEFWPMQIIKTRAFFNAYEVPNNANINIWKKYVAKYNFFFVTPFVICALFCLGVVVLLPRWRNPEISLLLGFIFFYALITITFFLIGRFRFPVVPLMYIVGVSGIAQIVSWLRSKNTNHVVFAVLTCLLALWVAWPRDLRGGFYQQAFKSYDGIRLIDYHNYAISKANVNDYEGMLNVVHEGLRQREGRDNPHLWVSAAQAMGGFPVMAKESSFKKKYEICEWFYRDKNRNLIGQKLNLRTINEAGFYGYCIDQLFLKAKKEKKTMVMLHFAKLGKEFNLSNRAQDIHNNRYSRRLRPVLDLKTYRQALGETEPKKPAPKK
jgi:hypothetical protein